MKIPLVCHLLLPAALLPLAAVGAASKSVTVSEDEASFTLGNGIVTARVSKASGDLASFEYQGVEMLNFNSGHAGGYWSHDVRGGHEIITKITIDAKSNGGRRAEVSVTGISGGIKMGHGPGAAEDGDFPADIEIRYSLGRGDSGIYTYCIFDHKAEYPAASMTEARFAAKLADMFDWMSINDQKSMHYPADLHEGDKYIYTAVQFENPFFGWSSTTANTGFWLINPSVEYLSGGPTKVEFLCHRDTTRVAAPIVLNYWRSSHYGGAQVHVGAGESWTKVIGPFLLYVNEGADPRAMWADARARYRLEADRWPYDWVSGVDYPSEDERATVSGQLVLHDAQATSGKLPNLHVGLAPATYDSPLAATNDRPIRPIHWQTNAKHYQFWALGDKNGSFTVPHVRPGTYTLYAFADGVLGEFERAEIIVGPGKNIDLGRLDWTPVRRGRQMWEIGIPNRNGSEFFMANEYADPAISLRYPELFPNDVTFEIGRSDYRKDWFFQHVPHNEDPDAAPRPYFGVRSEGRATPYTIEFDLADQPQGRAILRLAICGTGASEIQITVNDRSVGMIDDLLRDGAITRHSIQGLWYERNLAFDASHLHAGTNTLTLTIPAGPVNDGVIYDYLRLELDE